MARPPHRPTRIGRRQVETLATCGVPETDIARTVGIDPKTLRKHYRHELDIGHILANVQVAAALWRKATGDGHRAVTAAIFWLKTRAGWRERSPDAETSLPVVVRRIISDPEGPATSLTCADIGGTMSAGDIR